MTWAHLLERLAGLLDDVPTRLAVAGLAGCLAASAALLWWASQGYVAGRATGEAHRGKRFRVDGESVILRSDGHFAGAQIFYRLVGAAMAEF